MSDIEDIVETQLKSLLEEVRELIIIWQILLYLEKFVETKSDLKEVEERL